MGGVQKTSLILFFLSAVIFASCSNMLASQGESSSARGCETGSVVFNGTISVTGALPVDLSHAELDSVSQSSVSRSALPSITIGDDYYYYVTATKTDGSNPFNINSIYNSELFDTTSGVTFALELATGNWNIECGIKKAKTSNEVSDDDLPVMSDTYPAPLTSANPVVNHTFYPKPGQSGEGKVELKISVHTGVSDFGRVTASCSKSAWAEKVSEPVYDGGSGKWIIQTNPSDTLPSGTYEVTFNFYNTSNILLYSTVQTINVFDNMLTNTWVSDGSGVIDDEGTFALSVSLVTSFARTTFYVGQTAAATSVEVTASDITGSGSPYAPFETVTKAVEVIAATGNSSKDYRIFVSGTVTGAHEISDAVNGKANSITIQGYNGLDTNGEPKDALSCSGSTDAVTLKVVSTVPVTLKNIKLLGDSTPTSKTMVLVLENTYETDVTIEDGVWITGNDTSSFTEETFSAVYVGGDGKLTMKGGKISGNKCMSGGGIVVGGTFVMTGGEISGNEATASGGGVYNVGSMFMYGSAVIGDSSKTSAATESNYSNKAEYGAGIYSLGNLYLGYSAWTSESDNKPAALTGGVFYNFSHDTGGIYQYANKTFLMNSGFVSYNAGRGIYVGNCSFTMSGGSVIGNTTFEPGNDYQTNGAGIYAGYASTVLISGGTISGNKAGEDGGGLYIAKSNTSVTIEGGTIRGNSADGKGNGIAIAYGYLKMKGNASVDSNNDVYLASGKVITVTGALTGTTPIATITPAAWSRGTTVVQADGTNVTDLTTYTDFFTFTQDGWKCKVINEKKSIALDAPIYVAEIGTGRTVCGADGSDLTGDGTKGAPYATIAKAIELLTDKDTDYTIFIDGEVTGTQTIPDTLKSDGTGSYNAKSVTLSGATGNTSDILNGNSQGTTLTVATAVPVTIKNLKITGGSATNGGGIYLGSDSNVTLSESIVTNNKSTGYGGGIAVYCASLIIDKSTITENRTTTETQGVGAGIALAGLAGSDAVTAEVTMKAGSVISGNKTYANKNGGGVALYIGKTQFTMEGGEISGNTAYSGGGVYMCNNAEFILEDGKISGNTATHSSGTVSGGGIYFCNQASLIMNGGEISGNEAKHYGGGVAFAADEKTPTFTMTGGVIKNNTITNTSGLGKGVSVNGTFNMSGNALVDSTNDVYLASGKTITITDSLSADGADNVISITPNSYTAGTPVLSGDAVGTEYTKFTVTSQDNGTLWSIGSDGKLKKLWGKKLAPDTVGDIVFNDGTATSYSSSLTLTDDEKAAAIAVIFYVGTECSNNDESRMLGVGLVRSSSGLPWCTSSADACNTYIESIVCREWSNVWNGDKDGSDNFTQIAAVESVNDTDDATKYPAFYFAINYASQTNSHVSGTNYETGWYLPSICELYYLYQKKDNVDNAITLCGGTILGTKDYWSSTQRLGSDEPDWAYLYDFDPDSIWGGYGANAKNDNSTPSYVCAIREF